MRKLSSTDASWYLRPVELDNEIYGGARTTFLNGFDVDSLKHDSTMVNALEDFTNYYFKDLSNFLCVKIWYRENGDNDSLVCVFNSSDKNYMKSIPVDDYMMGSIMKHHLFVLWPGEKNISGFNSDSKMVWQYNGDDKDIVGFFDKDSLSWTGGIYENGRRKEVRISWYSKKPRDMFGIYGFSYDGHLAIEIDCQSFDTKSYNYMSHLMFRNSVRKYMNIMGNILDHPRYKRNNGRN